MCPFEDCKSLIGRLCFVVVGIFDRGNGENLIGLVCLGIIKMKTLFGF